MHESQPENLMIYKVVASQKEQYPIWPVDRENAMGWGMSAGKGQGRVPSLD
jgi:MbtH protein